MRRIICLLAVCVLNLFVARAAHADLWFQFADSEGILQSSFFIPLGGTLEIGVYLWDNGSSDDPTNPDFNYLRNEGLFAAAFSVQYATPTVARVLSDTDISHNPAFDDLFEPLKNVGADFAELVEVVDIFSPPVFPDGSLLPPERIWLGNFKFAGLSAGSTQIIAASPVTLFGSTMTGAEEILDLLIAPGIATVNVAVPEPSSILLCLTALTSVGLCRVLRKRRCSSAQAPRQISWCKPVRETS